MSDITETRGSLTSAAEEKRFSPLALIQRERHVLSQIAAGVPLAQVLENLLLAVEAQNDHTMLTSVLFLSEDGQHLRHGAAPSLPAPYNEAIDGIAIGEGVGSCGTVAARGTPVYATDIATDPLWKDFRDLALSHDLRACWSTPIEAADGTMLGTFAIYYGASRAPTEDDIEAIAFVTQTAALAIERYRSDMHLQRNQEQLRAANAELEAANRGLHERFLVGQENQDRLTTAIRVARLGAYVWNTATGAIELDGRSRAIFGLRASGPLRQEDVFARIDPDQFGAVFERAQAGLAAGAKVEIDYPVIWPNGQRRMVRSLGDVATNAQGERLMVGIVHDITSEKHIEDTLRAEKALLEREVETQTANRDRLWRNSLDLLAITDPDGTLDAVNGAWTARLGWTEAELVGRTFVALVHPDDLQPTLAAFGGILTAPIVEPYEYRLRHKDETYRWFAWTAVFEGGKIYANGRDVTAERGQAEILRQTEEALRQSQKMEAVGQLTGGLAHDFNNLLTGITGSLELLGTRVMQGRYTDLSRYIGAAQGAAGRAAALTHRLLAFSRRQTLDPKPTDANRLIADMEELIRRTVGPAVAVESVGAVGLWTTLVDPNQLENALLNLCINARDAMPEGGRLTIETANRWLDQRSGRERDLAPGQYLSLCVSDTGAGMPPDVIAKAFDPFFTTKPLGQGTGLGLSMIYGFVRQSGGQARIYSEPGQGTTVCIYLPRYFGDADVAGIASELADAPRAAQGETVVVVDDEPTVRMLVTEVLEDLGYAAIEAADGASGLRVLQSDAQVDLLVTDVGLPGGMNGRQMADAARQHRPGLKVLFITGYAENAVVGNGHLEPGMHVMTKPFAMEALANRMRELIAGG